MFWISGRLREVLVYERFKLQGFDWENFGVLDWCSLIWEVVRLTIGDCTWRFDCILLKIGLKRNRYITGNFFPKVRALIGYFETNTGFSRLKCQLKRKKIDTACF